MKIFVTLTFCITILFINPLFSCVNEYQTLITGEMIYTDAHMGLAEKRFVDTLYLLEEAAELLALYQETDSVKYWSDYAAALIYLGKYHAAKSIYHQIEERKADLYITASNLGTIYELIGMPDSALYWINKSLVLNPNSHHGSEWIHIKILEHKLASQIDSAASILGLDFGTDSLPGNPMNRDLLSLSTQLNHQLSERMYFVNSPNWIVGNLLADFGHISAQVYSLESAIATYEKAKEYGYSDGLVNQRIVTMTHLSAQANLYRQIQKKTNLSGGELSFVASLLRVMAIVAMVVVSILFIRKIYKSW